MKGVLVFAIFMVAVPAVFAESNTGTTPTECSVRTACLAMETCWFKYSNDSNAHLGSCSSSYTYSICCTHTDQANIKTSCASDEYDILLMGNVYGESTITNLHAGDFYSPYTNRLCIQSSSAYFSCEVVEKGNQANKTSCFVSLSNTTNAHVGSCSYGPYEYGLYCRAQEIPKKNHTLRISLRVYSLDDRIFVPGQPVKSFTALTTADYEPLSPYIEANNGFKLYGLVGYEGTTQLRTEKDATSYVLSVVQQQDPNKAAIVFGRGDLELFQSNVAEFQQNSFELVGLKAFGVQKESTDMVVEQGITYEKFVFRGSDTLSPGTYQLKFEHLGTRDKKILIKVNTVRE